jgi:hypothetical protein
VFRQQDGGGLQGVRGGCSKCSTHAMVRAYHGVCIANIWGWPEPYMCTVYDRDLLKTPYIHR